MRQLTVGYRADSARALAHAQRGMQALRKLGYYAKAVGLWGEPEPSCDLWVADGSEAEARPTDRWALAAVAERVAAGPVRLGSRALTADQPAQIWAHERAWLEVWATQHPNHTLSLREGSVREVISAFDASGADALLIGADLIPAGLDADRTDLVTPAGRGIAVWLAPTEATHLPDLLSPLHHPPSAQLLSGEWQLAQALSATGRAYVTSRWTDTPGGGEIAVEVALLTREGLRGYATAGPWSEVWRKALRIGARSTSAANSDSTNPHN